MMRRRMLLACLALTAGIACAAPEASVLLTATMQKKESGPPSLLSYPPLRLKHVMFCGQAMDITLQRDAGGNATLTRHTL